MASLNYLQPGEYAAYGVSGAADNDIRQASDIINGYLKRPEGLIWIADTIGRPTYMAGLDPLMTYSAPGDIAPGLNVVVALSNDVSPSLVGEALVLDRALDEAVEICAVIAADPAARTITLARVVRHHTGPISLDLGLVIAEERSLPSGRSVTRLSRGPVMRLVSGVGRYAYGRRSDQAMTGAMEIGLMSALQAFGGPVPWIPFDATSADVSAGTGEVWIPSGTMMANFSDVRLRYVAGWPATGLPMAIKQATANLVRALGDFPAGASVRSVSSIGVNVSRFSNTLLDADTQRLLDPFSARTFT